MSEKETIREIERALLRIVRNLGKRRLDRGMERRLAGLVDFSHVAVVDSLCENDEARGPATVGQVARRIDLDHSRASRMVAAAIRAGYARRVVSQEDGRRTCVALTDKGEEFAGAIRNLRHRTFAAHLKSWSDADCREFARLLTRFAQGPRQDRQEHDERAGGETLTARENVVVLRPASAVGKKRRKRRMRAPVSGPHRS